jgi:hypothetical protein
MSRLVLPMIGLAWLAAGCASSGSLASQEDDGVAAVETPIEVVTADELLVDVDGSAEDRRLICRELLRPASNQIVSRCMTPAGWQTYDRAQEEWAQMMLRQLQGSPYR